MGYLTEREWILFNDIVREIYTTKSLEEFSQRFLALVRKLIPYHSSSVAVVKEDGTVEEKQIVLVGKDKMEDVQLYNKKYVKMDYTNVIFDFPRSSSFRDIDIVNEEEMKKTVIYKEFFEPRGKKYSGGLVIKTEQRDLCITLYRDELNGPLTEKEMFILEQFIGHLENMVRLVGEAEPVEKLEDRLPKEMENVLTERERQIFPYVLRGYTNLEIGNQFFISESTAKKHVYHIFEKLQVKNRGELIRKFAK